MIAKCRIYFQYLCYDIQALVAQDVVTKRLTMAMFVCFFMLTVGALFDQIFIVTAQ